MLESTRPATFCVFEACDGVPVLNPILPLVLDIDGDEPTQTATTEEFIRKQAEENLCKQMAKTIGAPESAYTYEKVGFLVLRSHIDGSIQNFNPKTLQDKTLYIYITQFWPGTQSQDVCTTPREQTCIGHAKGFYATVKDCRSCASTILTAYERQKNLLLFPPSVSL